MHGTKEERALGQLPQRGPLQSLARKAKNVSAKTDTVRLMKAVSERDQCRNGEEREERERGRERTGERTGEREREREKGRGRGREREGEREWRRDGRREERGGREREREGLFTLRGVAPSFTVSPLAVFFLERVRSLSAPMEPCPFLHGLLAPAEQESQQVVTENLDLVKDRLVERIPERIVEKTVELAESLGEAGVFLVLGE